MALRGGAGGQREPPAAVVAQHGALGALAARLDIERDPRTPEAARRARRSAARRVEKAREIGRVAERARREKIGAAQSDGIGAECARGLLHQAFHQHRGFGPPRAAIDADGRTCRPAPADRKLDRADAIGPGQNAHGVARGHGRRIGEPMPEIGVRLGAQAQKTSVGGERQFALDLQGAAVGPRHEFFGPRGDPQYGLVELGRRQGHRRFLGDKGGLAAERAADIGCDDPDRALAKPEDRRQIGARAMRGLRREMDREFSFMARRQDRARFQRHRCDARIGERDAYDLRGRGECRLDVAGRPSLREARRRRIVARFDFDPDRLDGVLRQRGRIGHDQCHGLPGGGDPVPGQYRPHARIEILGQRIHRRPAEPRRIGTGQDQTHARHSRRRRHIDADEPCRSFGRAREGGMQRARGRQIGDETPFPPQQSFVLDARQRRAQGPLRHPDVVAGHDGHASSVPSANLRD